MNPPERPESPGAESRATCGVNQVMVLRRRLRDTLSKTYLNTTPAGDGFNLLVSEICTILSKEISFETVHQSLYSLAGQVLTREILDSTCWRLAGNIQRLKQHRPVPPWSRQPFKEWVPVQIYEARPKRNFRGDPGMLFTFKVIAGTSCPQEIKRFWSLRFCRFVAPNLGFSARRQSDRLGTEDVVPYRYHYATELVTLRLEVLIDPALSAGAPGFERISCSSSLFAYNREQLKFRERLAPKYACPFNYPASHPCRLCAKGWQSCRAAVHRRDYVFGVCGLCERPSAPFDFDISTEMCVECFVKREDGERNENRQNTGRVPTDRPVAGV